MDENLFEEKPKKWPIILLAIFVLLAVGYFWLRSWYRSGGLQNAVVNVVSNKITENNDEKSLIQKVLGFDAPKTYLLLFLNNTEIRPAGGFIGAYAVVRVDKGKPEILKVDGTEILDNMSDFAMIPPEPLKKFLGIKNWKFRDSNWSPDFMISSKNSLDFFRKENGTAGTEISGVIGFTPTVLEEILKISGPIEVRGEKFTPENFVEKLEYEVEFGYADKGFDFDNRKQILKDLTHALTTRLAADVFMNWSKYFSVAEKMLQEKHVMAYSENAEEQSVLKLKNWTGEMSQATGDYVMWADANLAALKTDRVIDRGLTYSFAKDKSGKFTGKIKMKYTHKGKFDQFTTRYRTYARVYLPLGAEFISVKGSMKGDRSAEPGQVDKGVENGRQWFGTFISIEPGKIGELEWQFLLAPSVVSMIEAGAYNLSVEKQAGIIDSGLTLDLNFGKNVSFASPGEPKENHGDTKYSIQTDLRIDKEFTVNLK